jgi:hypothetical protein
MTQTRLASILNYSVQITVSYRVFIVSICLLANTEIDYCLLLPNASLSSFIIIFHRCENVVLKLGRYSMISNRFLENVARLKNLVCDDEGGHLTA